MKRICLVLILFLISTLPLVSCNKNGSNYRTTINISRTPTISPTTAPTSDKNSDKQQVVSNDQLKETKDYLEIGMELTDTTIKAMFGDYSVELIEKKLGNPINSTQKSDFERWYMNHGIEIDVVTQNDVMKMLFNYIFFNESSDIKTDRGIGVGNTKDEVYNAYKEEINPELTDSTYIVAGIEDAGIIFAMENDKVNSFYITTQGFTSDGHTLKR